MPVINIDLEDGMPKISFSLKNEDADRFINFMAECEEYKSINTELITVLETAINGLRRMRP